MAARGPERVRGSERTVLTQMETTVSGWVEPSSGHDLGGHVHGRVKVFAAETLCARLDEVFRSDGTLRCVAVRGEQGALGLVMRSRFEQAMTGPFGFGRALLGRRPVGELAHWEPLVLSPETSVDEASHLLRRRPLAHAHDDILIKLGHGQFGRISAAAMFDVVAQGYADQAVRDTLTGLANRRLFLQRLVTACQEANSGGGAVLVAFVDLDGMKQVNDAQGHNAGDTLLVAVARRLAAAAPRGALVARLGSDEFAILARARPAAADRSHGQHLGECLRKAVSASDPRLPTGVRTRASVGVAMSGSPTDAQTLLSEADMAMYQAKQSGGDSVVVTMNVGTQLCAQPDLIGRTVLQAIEHNELRLVYQPIVDVRTGAIVCVEALVRWEHPRLGSLAPDQFLPGAQRAGHLPALDQWVLVTACAEFATLTARMGSSSPTQININISTATLSEPHLDHLVVNALAQSGLASRQVCLELPESADHCVLTGAKADLDWLRSLGVSIALDDMGAGSSTLKHLSLLAVTDLKIDKSFVSGMLDNQRDHAVVRLLTDLGRTLNLGVIAEGVETRQQLAELDRLGVDRVQGYFVGRPQPADELAATVLSAARHQPVGTGVR